MRSVLTPPVPDLVLRTQWYMRLRWVLILLIAVPGAYSLYLGEGWSEQVQRDSLLAAVMLSSNLFFWISLWFVARRRSIQQQWQGFVALLKQAVIGGDKGKSAGSVSANVGLTRDKAQTMCRVIAAIMLVLDIFFISMLIYTKGGIESRSVILYTIPVLISASIFGRRYAHAAALSSVIVYSALILADYKGVITTVGSLTLQLHYNLSYVINSIVFIGIIILVISLLVDLILRYQLSTIEAVKAMHTAQSLAKLGSWEWDPKRDNLVLSHELSDLFHLTSGDARDASFLELIFATHPDDRQRFIREVERAMKLRQAFSIEHRIIGEDNKLRHAQTEGTPIIDQHNEIVKVLSTTRDETQDKEQEASHAKLVSFISHEVHTPAISLQKDLQNLMHTSANKLNRDEQALLQSAFDSSTLQLQLMKDLLQLVNQPRQDITMLHLAKVDVDKLVVHVLDELGPLFAIRGQTILLDSRTDVSFVVDRRKLRRVITILTGSISKFARDGATIRVKVKVVKDKLKIVIADEGGPASRRMFTRRWEGQPKQSKDTSGFGLYAATRIVTEHGGTVNVLPPKNKGISVVITIPSLKNPKLK